MTLKWIKGPGRADSGFTLVEALVVLVVFGLFSGVIYAVYSSSMSSYKAAAWKQDVAYQCEIFWSILRKNLEEASNSNVIDLTTFTITANEKKLVFRSVPTTPATGKNGILMAWVKRRHGLDGGGNVTFLYELSSFLSLNNRAVRLEITSIGGGTPPANELTDKVFLQDVEGFVVKATPINVSDSTGEEYLGPVQGTDKTVASILEISIIFTPPPNIANRNLIITQNNKFRINVATQGTADPAFPPYN